MEVVKEQDNKDLKNTSKSAGGARVGAGRKKGGINSDGKDRLEALKQFKDRVAANLDRLFNAQLNLAQGTTYMYRVEMRVNKQGKEYEAHELVTDPEEIKQALDRGLEESNGVNYYYITTKDPDNKAIDSMIDRTFGKPQQAMDLTTNNKDFTVSFFNYLSGDKKEKDTSKDTEKYI